MFGWFSSKCPVRTSDKTWTEHRMRWLTERIGLERLRKARVILPTANFFPEPYRGNSKDVSSMLSRVGYFMGIDTKHLKLEVIPNDQLRGAVGQYQRGRRPVIRVVQSQLADPERLVADVLTAVTADAPKRVREILQEMEERDERFCALAVQIVEKKAAL